MTDAKPPKSLGLIYKPSNYRGPQAKKSTLAVKFANQRVILDDYLLIGGEISGVGLNSALSLHGFI